MSQELSYLQPFDLEMRTGSQLAEDFRETQRLEKIRQEYPPAYQNLVEESKNVPDRKPRVDEQKTSVDHDFKIQKAGVNQDGERVSIQLRGDDNENPKRQETLNGQVDKVLGRVWVNSKLNRDGTGKEVSYIFGESGKVYKREYTKYNYDYNTNQRTWIDGTEAVELDSAEIDALNIMLREVQENGSGADQTPNKKKPQK